MFDHYVDKGGNFIGTVGRGWRGKCRAEVDARKTSSRHGQRVHGRDERALRGRARGAAPQPHGGGHQVLSQPPCHWARRPGTRDDLAWERWVLTGFPSWRAGEAQREKHQLWR